MPIKKHIRLKVPLKFALFNWACKAMYEKGYDLEFAYKENLGFQYIGKKAIKRKIAWGEL